MYETKVTNDAAVPDAPAQTAEQPAEIPTLEQHIENSLAAARAAVEHAPSGDRQSTVVTADSLIRTVRISKTLALYPDVDFVFILRLKLTHERELSREIIFGLQGTAYLQGRENMNIGDLCDLLVEEPQGFGDFPTDDRQMAVRAREYFVITTGGAFYGLINDVMRSYWDLVTPMEGL